MSFYSDASLVMIPSGYKASKVYSAVPTDGAGDLVFSRTADTATRVGPDGLIEKVRTNLITYSQAFDNAAWTKGGVGTFTSAITTGFTDPTGGTNAQRWLATIASVSDRAFVRQLATLTSGAPYTISFWVKSNTASSQDIYFMFQGGAVQATTATTSWQRISYSATTSTTSVLVGIEAKDLAIDVLVYGFQVEYGDVATDYIATTSAAVSIGPVANVPRLDYLGSSCPRLLLEPQRTNVYLNSENFATSDSVSGGAITSNVETSPDGYLNADKIQGDGSSSTFQVFNNITVAASTIYTFSVFAKAGNTNFVQLSCTNMDTDTTAVFDLSLGTITLTGASSSPTITNYGNGWYRCSIQMVAQTTDLSGRFRIYVPADGSGAAWSGTSANGKNIFLYGRQLEAGAYATSYIPTLGAAVTRGADAASKTGISSLIGQTEGTIYGEFTTGGLPAVDQYYFNLSDGTTSNIIYIGFYATILVARVIDAGTLTVNINVGLQPNTTYKVAFAYKANDCKVYINGVDSGTDTSATIPAVSKFGMNEISETANYKVAQALLFKTRLSNADLAALTA